MSYKNNIIVDSSQLNSCRICFLHQKNSSSSSYFILQMSILISRIFSWYEKSCEYNNKKKKKKKKNDFLSTFPLRFELNFI